MEQQDELTSYASDVAVWRDGKRHRTDPLPEALRQRGRTLAKTHGLSRVCRAAKLSRRHIEGRKKGGPRPASRRPPDHSVIVVPPPAATPAGHKPLVELTSRRGLKVTLFDGAGDHSPYVALFRELAAAEEDRR